MSADSINTLHLFSWSTQSFELKFLQKKCPCFYFKNKFFFVYSHLRSFAVCRNIKFASMKTHSNVFQIFSDSKNLYVVAIVFFPCRVVFLLILLEYNNNKRLMKQAIQTGIVFLENGDFQHYSDWCRENRTLLSKKENL